MIRFTGKCLLIAIVMFFGVLFGMRAGKQRNA